jgi:hypothetical protein
VVYVDNDPIVIAHARALLTGKPGTTDYRRRQEALIGSPDW